jgi:vacuolar-type H+-ATPase subunit I/STV1
MELSILIAKIASVIYLSAALGAVLNRDHYQRVLDDLFENAALTYFMGFTTVVLGFLMVNYHNIWVKDWTVLVTSVGWAALIKGILLIVVPKFVQSYSRLIFEAKGQKLFPYTATFLGLLFGYFGFVY